MPTDKEIEAVSDELHSQEIYIDDGCGQMRLAYKDECDDIAKAALKAADADAAATAYAVAAVAAAAAAAAAAVAERNKQIIH